MYLGTKDGPYSSNLSTLFFYRGIGIKGKARNAGTLGLLDQNPFGILSRHLTLGILGSLDGPLLLEFARLNGRHVGQLWALLRQLFKCSSNWAVQLIWLLCDNVIQKPGRGWMEGQVVRLAP